LPKSRCRASFRFGFDLGPAVVSGFCWRPTILGAIAFAGDRDDVRVMNEPVQHRRGEDGIGEHLAPEFEGFVAIS
jgi:hypothetical protein